MMKSFHLTQKRQQKFECEKCGLRRNRYLYDGIFVCSDCLEEYFESEENWLRMMEEVLSK